jgi:hypothetical protein
MKGAFGWLKKQMRSLVGRIVTGVVVGIIVALLITVVWPWIEDLIHGEPVEIISVQFDAPGDDSENLNGEWIKIENQGSDDINMSDWTLSDLEDHFMSFPPDFTLAAGQTVTVYTGCGDNCQTELYWGRKAPVWNNDSDTAILCKPDGWVISERQSR